MVLVVLGLASCGVGANPVKFGGEDFFEPLNKGAEKFF